MAAPPASPQQDNSLTPLWVVAGIFLAIIVIWLTMHAQIVMIVYKLKEWEIAFLNLFPNDLKALEQQLKAMKPADYYAVSYQDLFNTCTLVGNYLRYPVIILFLAFACLLFVSHAGMRFRNTYTMQRLVDEEKDNWPQIMPIAKLDLGKQDIDKGPWAMALTPMQFAKRYGLLQEERIIHNDPNVLRRVKTTVSVIKPQAYRAFALQLGDYWTGPENLNIHTKALFAVFAARANRDRDGANELLQRIAASTGTGKLDFTGTNELLNKHKNFKSVVKVTQRHAFILTVMASMLKLAREDGVVASADFLWLKPVDRTLWYMLNAVGRQTAFAEIAGPFAHWLAEVNFGKKLMVPMVDEAVLALEGAIKEIIYKPDNED